MIRAILRNCVERRKTITYGDLGRQVGRSALGPWPELDAIYEEDMQAGRPDLTLCVVSARTGMTAKYRQQPLKLADAARSKQYFEDLERLFAHYQNIQGGTAVPRTEP